MNLAAVSTLNHLGLDRLPMCGTFINLMAITQLAMIFLYGKQCILTL